MEKPRQIGWIWPKDPLPGNPLKWPFGQRFKDVLSNKGPDVFVGSLDGPRSYPKTPRWARWQDLYGDPDDDPTPPPLFKCCDRGLKRYDFKTRKYKIPDANTWSYVQYSNGGKDPLVFWDPQMIMIPYVDWMVWNP
ncbi:hypothetical protein LOZ61_004202 [Ophidiomyces ophidiicola]|nr:hypothetical protein LOZ61_004202 [Ophidiomyces ophidiicola]KAI1959184.1 hypothetical protein LOZ59_003235 [Ophidiomyces ophidiicola]KAI1974384.1 hypothetical protein LOZ55_005084 [Ophidiomyces ophidiicola]KAI1985962.1 hypothetical protein LOZ54_004071 [Ophidiomyces ophidiicola]KAI2020206.1 hypothetical protein LOZ45_005229 [Ophidiomyces ophidiicola]